MIASSYEVLEVQDPTNPLPADLSADFAVIGRDAIEGDGESFPLPIGLGGDAHTLVVTWIRSREDRTVPERPISEDEANDIVRRIFGAIASPYVGRDGDSARRLAYGLHLLRSKIWNRDPAETPPNIEDP